MSEKRKPKITFLLKWEANGKIKRNRIELFDANLFGKPSRSYRAMFRMRVNGKWFTGDKGQEYFYKTEIRDILWRSIPFLSTH